MHQTSRLASTVVTLQRARNLATKSAFINATLRSQLFSSHIDEIDSSRFASCNAFLLAPFDETACKQCRVSHRRNGRNFAARWSSRGRSCSANPTNSHFYARRGRENDRLDGTLCGLAAAMRYILHGDCGPSVYAFFISRAPAILSNLI